MSQDVSENKLVGVAKTLENGLGRDDFIQEASNHDSGYPNSGEIILVSSSTLFGLLQQLNHIQVCATSSHM